MTYLFVLCCLLKIGIAQIYFNNRYDIFNSCDGYGTISNYQGAYLGTGNVCTNISYFCLNLGKFDYAGTMFDSKTYIRQGSGFQSTFSKNVFMPNSDFIVGGARAYKPDTSLVFLWRFNSNLDSIKYSEYGYLNKTNFLGAIERSGKYIYMAGSTDSLYKNTQILLIKTDTVGNEIWKKKIGLPNWDETGYCIKQCANGNLLIGGLKDLRTTSQQGPFLMRLDTSGAVLWENYYPSATYANGSFDVTELPNGDIVFTGGMAYNVTSNGTLRRPMLTRVDAGGNLIWQKEYGEKAVGHDFFTFVINEKNNFVVSGVKFYPDNSCVGMVYEINQNGDSLFSREYTVEPGSQNYFRDLVQAPDKGYVFSGFITPVFPNGGTGTQDIWLLKTDSTFCESMVSCNYPTGIMVLNSGTDKLTAYPNPAQNELYIKLENNNAQYLHITLKDVSGRMMTGCRITTTDNEVRIDVSNLANGTYYCTIEQTNRPVIAGKIIILK
jgi:hypothetical protein